MEVKIAVAPLQLTTGKPPGYYEDFLRNGRIENGELVIDQSVCTTLLQKYANLAGASSRVIKAIVKREKILASVIEQERRILICKVCEFFNGTSCAKCGCVIKLKSRLETMHCPINKW